MDRTIQTILQNPDLEAEALIKKLLDQPAVSDSTDFDADIAHSEATQDVRRGHVETIWVEGSGVEGANGGYYRNRDSIAAGGPPFEYCMIGELAGVPCKYTLQKEGRGWFLAAEPDNASDRINLYWNQAIRHLHYPPTKGWLPWQTKRGFRDTPPELVYEGTGDPNLRGSETQRSRRKSRPGTFASLMRINIRR